MPTVGELSDPYANFMLNPQPAGSGVCRVCLTFTDGFDTCFRCGHFPVHADAVLPISYSLHFGQLHTALRGYKRSSGSTGRKLQLDLAAVLWRFLALHERCLAVEAGVPGFDVVTTVPSGDLHRDETHPLRAMVGHVIEPTTRRYRPILARTSKVVEARAVDPEKFAVVEGIRGESVLLIDDTWTTGANVQSAAGALKARGAHSVGVIVIGRHIHESYGNNAERLKALPRPFDWNVCALE